jgi:hypothetical protein
MNRPLATLAFLALGLGAAAAQDATPAAPAALAPATPAEVTIDPAANVATPPKQATMLTGFYATKAIIELCNITVEPKIAEGMGVDQQRLEQSLGMDPATAEKAYATVKADVEKTAPDCAPTSSDRVGVDAVLAIYTANAAKAAAAPAAPAIPAAPAAPAPAATPAPAAPAN